jgi:hypothetical protein
MRGCRLRGFHRIQQYAPRVATSALVVCCIALNPVLASSASAQVVATEQEVGTLHWGPTVVWLRATDAGVVQVYASTGYRSAFVQPVALNIDDVDRWATLLEQLASPTQISATSAHLSDGDASRVTLGGGDLVLEMELATASEPKLQVWVGASRPDAVVALVVPEGADQAALLLRSAAHVARRLRDAATRDAAATTAAAADPTPPVHTEIATVPLSQTAISRTASEPPAVPDPPAAPVGAPESPVVETNVVQAPPVLTRAPVTAAVPATRALPSARQTTTVIKFIAPASQPARPAHTGAIAIPVLKTTTATTPLRVAAPALASITTVNSAPQRSTVHQRSVVAGTAHTVSSSATHVTSTTASNGVDDATVQNLVGQWRPELMYCYTQFGLREHASLAGALVVRVALSPSGSVGHSVIGSRNWNGDGGAEVESCIRSRVGSWHFPPANAGSIHAFTLDFAPGRS